MWLSRARARSDVPTVRHSTGNVLSQVYTEVPALLSDGQLYRRSLNGDRRMPYGKVLTDRDLDIAWASICTETENLQVRLAEIVVSSEVGTAVRACHRSSIPVRSVRQRATRLRLDDIAHRRMVRPAAVAVSRGHEMSECSPERSSGTD
jgi:hypothetical protein